jgi:cytochrome b
MKSDLTNRKNLDVFTRILHLGLAVFGVLALITGDFADDYKKLDGLGFFFHSWTGIGVAIFICLRIMYGIMGPIQVRFTNWVPYSKERFKLVLEDIAGLLQFRLPERQPREGLAALVEIFGLLLFLFLAVTGLLLFLSIQPGREAQGIAHFIKELHEVGETLLPLFLIVHGGAVILHGLTGNPLWRKMFFLKER